MNRCGVPGLEMEEGGKRDLLQGPSAPGNSEGLKGI